MSTMIKLPVSSSLPDGSAMGLDPGAQRSAQPRGLSSLADMPSFASLMQQHSAEGLAVDAADSSGGLPSVEGLDKDLLGQEETLPAVDSSGQTASVALANVGSQIVVSRVPESFAPVVAGRLTQALEALSGDKGLPVSGAVDVLSNIAGSEVSDTSGVLDMAGAQTVPGALGELGASGASGASVAEAALPLPVDVVASSLDAGGAESVLPGRQVRARSSDSVLPAQTKDGGRGLPISVSADSLPAAEPAQEQDRREIGTLPTESFGMMAWLMGLPPEVKPDLRNKSDTGSTFASARSDELTVVESKSMGIRQAPALREDSLSLPISAPQSDPSVLQGVLVQSNVIDGEPAFVDRAPVVGTGRKSTAQTQRAVAELKMDDRAQTAGQQHSIAEKLLAVTDTQQYQPLSALLGSAQPSVIGESSLTPSLGERVHAEGGLNWVTGSQAGQVVLSNAAPVRYESATLMTPLAHPDFSQALAEKVSLWVNMGRSSGAPVTAELHLNPAEMGPIQVKIAIEGQSAKIEFAASVAETRKVIEASMPTLSSALSDVGLNLTGGGVSSETSGRSFGQQPEQSRQSSGPVSSSRSSALGEADDAVTVMPAASRLRAVRVGGLDLYA